MYNMQSVRLSKGKHRNNESEKCAMEAVAFIAGEEHTDHPKCVCGVIGEFVRTCNDWFTQSERDEYLLPILWDFIGTAAPDDDTILKRGYICADYAVRVFATIGLETIGLFDEATNLRSLPEIVDGPTVDEAHVRVTTAIRKASDYRRATISASVHEGRTAIRAINAADDTLSCCTRPYSRAFNSSKNIQHDSQDKANRAASAAFYAAAGAEILDDFTECCGIRHRVVQESVNCIRTMIAVRKSTTLALQLNNDEKVIF